MADHVAIEADTVNRPVWARDVQNFAIEGWLDPGELRATLFAADLARGLPILDLGVGAGRTVSILRLISSDYRAVDYVPDMVEACRARHPGIDVSHGDARELAGMPDAFFGLVAFSSNGIDAVDHTGRKAVFRTVRRVLAPSGTFFFSTLNKHSRLFGATPGTAPELSWIPGSLLPIRHAGPTPGEPVPSVEDPRWVRAVKNWRALRKSTEDHGDWGVAPFAAHDFGLLTHFVTVTGVRAELDDHGFDVLGIFACEDGAVISGETSETMYMHVVARRR